MAPVSHRLPQVMVYKTRLRTKSSRQRSSRKYLSCTAMVTEYSGIHLQSGSGGTRQPSGPRETSGAEMCCEAALCSSYSPSLVLGYQ